MLELLDDGTMDTVLECPSCRKEIRYMSADRDEHGYIYDSWMKWASEEHEEECVEEEE